MDEAEDQLLPPPPSTPLFRRRNSIPTSLVIPTNLTLPSKPLHTSSLPPPHSIGAATSPLPSLDFELVSLKSSLSYTSLKDLLPSTAVNSPTSAAAASSPSALEISIRNRLVKQAAWAYLQPMSSSPSSSGTNLLQRIWLQFSARNPICACIRFISRVIIPSIAGAIDRILCAIRVHMGR